MPSRLLSKLYGSLIQIIQLPISILRKATIRSYQQYSRSSSQTIANSTRNNTSLATTIYVSLQSIPSRYVNPYITQRALNRLSLPLASRLTKNIYRPRSTVLALSRSLFLQVWFRLYTLISIYIVANYYRASSSI